MNDATQISTPPEAPKKNNTPLIIGIVVVVLCCCCLVVGLGGWYAWNNGDSWMNSAGAILNLI
jgi:hypothetical protein